MENEVAVGGGIAAAIILIVYLAVIIIMIASFWKIFSKAGRPGWAAIVPIYNIIVFLDVAGKPWWWIFLFCIPILNVIMGIIAIVGLAEKFGKGAGFAVGLILLGVIFYPILAFGDAEYQG